MKRNPFSQEQTACSDAAALLRGALKMREAPRPTNEGWIPPSVEELSPLIPDYEIIEMIGQGGMGAVYRAKQKKLDRWAAVKVLRSENPGGDLAERFQREARALAPLNHQNIVSVYDYGETSAGHRYLVMEYVEGSSLQEMLCAGRLELASALDVMSQVCDALHYLHGEGFVHRDIKPANVLVDVCGRVKVADFGLAKEVRPDQTGLTMEGGVVGTGDYMAPEQRDGSGKVDQRADFYAMGIMIYELLTGERPAGNWSPPSGVIKSHRGAGRIIDRVVARSLKKEPEARYRSAEEMKFQLEMAQGKMRKRSAIRWAQGATAFVLVAGAVGAGRWWGWRGHAQHLEREKHLAELKAAELDAEPFFGQLSHYHYVSVTRDGDDLLALASSKPANPAREFEIDGEGIRFYYRDFWLLRIGKGGNIKRAAVSAGSFPVWLEGMDYGALDVQNDRVRAFVNFKSIPGSSAMSGNVMEFNKYTMNKDVINVFTDRNWGWYPILRGDTLEVYGDDSYHVVTFELVGLQAKQKRDVPMLSTAASERYKVRLREQSGGLLPDLDASVVKKIYDEFK